MAQWHGSFTTHVYKLEALYAVENLIQVPVAVCVWGA